MNAQNSSEGHRQRLRARFLKSGLDGFHDYEIVELLLTLGSPRRDCKPPAKELIQKLGSLKAVLAASDDELQQVKGVGPSNSFGIKLVREVASLYLKEKAVGKPVFSSAKEIFDYLYVSMGCLKKEIFKVIYLDSQNQVLGIAELSRGTVDSSFVSPREVVEGAIKHNATALIFVHNHPSGSPKPSNDDRLVTRDLVYTGNIVQIKVLDHIIIGEGRYFSFAAEGLIDEYGADFVNLKMRGTAAGKRLFRRAKSGEKPGEYRD
ncbi:MAG: JAB domain-containing protein [Dehalococcoidia bacterium]|jgi:DNA repair protein RadC|nr:MAG: JAB domain-containing protein [Dehalococcoidia bacterium]